MSSTHAADRSLAGSENGKPRDPRKFYRFALYGRSGSGKTCVLARMAMGALGHPDGLTCTRLPVTVPKPSGDPKSFGPREVEAFELHDGQDWIVKAINRLRDGERPGGNVPDGQFSPTVDFEINDPRRGATFVRMIDYAGELISGDQEHDPKSMANALKARLQRLDGLIVLADASSGGERGKVLGDEHKLLREALKSLSDDPNFKPAAIVVAFAKWDRESEIDPDNPEAEYARLDDFLAIDRARHHKDLVDSIRKVVPGDRSRRIAFPASAFGKSVIRDGADHPVQGRDGERPRPFGILEPLLALADLRDAIDAGRVEEELASAPWWSPRQFGKLRKLQSRAAGLLSRMPESSAEAKRIQRTSGIALRQFWSVTTALVAVLATGLYVGAGWEINSRRFAQLDASVSDPGITENQLVEARGRLERYAPGGLARRFLPFAPVAAKVDEVQNRIDAALDDILWSPVVTAPELSKKADEAKKYLERLPLGRHAEDAKDIIKRREIQIVDQAADTRLSDWDKRIQEADADKTELLDILSEMRSWVYGGGDDSKLTRRDALARRCVDQMAAKNWGDIVGILESKRVKEAAEKWGQLAGADEHWKDHVPELIARIQKITEGNISESLKQMRFDEASRILDEARDGLTALERPTREHAPELVETVMAAIREAGTEGPLGTRIRREKDFAKYEEFRKTSTPRLAQEYLSDFSTGAMRKQVESYLAYLNGRSNATRVEIAAFILWDKDYPDGRTGQILNVWMDDVKVLEAKELKSSSGNMSAEIGKFVKSTPAGDFVNTSSRFGVRMHETGNLWGTSPVGEGATVPLKLSILEGDGCRVPVRTEKGDYPAQVVLRIVSGIPQKPELPQWKDPSSSR